jgi:hypothetical protein
MRVRRTHWASFSSALPPALDGINDNPYVRDFGVALMPELYSHLERVIWSHVRELERQLADELRRQGFAVWQK